MNKKVEIEYLFRLNGIQIVITRPLALAFLSTDVIPFLLMVLIADVETFSVIHLSSSGM